MSKVYARLGVDIGGTFTDAVLDVDGTLHSAKILTSNAAPENAIVKAMQQTCTTACIEPSQIGQVIHGTTLATNALIERRGAKTALITTKGFRDVIEMRTESRFEQYDLNISLPDPLLPRNRRYVVTERLDATGSVLVPLDRDELESLVDEIAAAGYESVAVGLLHSYANDTHERNVADMLAKRLPNALVSLSSRVSPQMREYDRFNTTIANAYIQPLIKSYLSRLRDRLKAVGADCPIFLMHSGGGIMSLESAAELPVRLVESGPAGGAIFAADIAARHGLDRVVSFDMGGTTAKISLIRNHRPGTVRTFEVARTYRFKKGSGMPISIPAIDMVEIGAGGGSLARVDSMNRIRVGPTSAGSEPGPACFGRGGTHPAVTDADLVLGRIDPTQFAGGSIQLYPRKATQALTEHIGNRLDMQATEAAWGLSDVVDENMANAARAHAVEKGEDIGKYTMIAFGGAAPLHAARLCEKLGIDRCLIPVGAGVGSAIGFLRAPFSFEATRSVYTTTDNFNSRAARNLFLELEDEATTFVRSCSPEGRILTSHRIFMRYRGQGWEIPVTLSRKHAQSPCVSTILALFDSEYSKLFGRPVAGLDAEITVWSVNARTKAVPSPSVETVAGDTPAPVSGNRQLFDPAKGSGTCATVVARENLSPGHAVDGPAVVTEAETTTVIPASRRVIALPDGCLDMRIRESGDCDVDRRRNQRA